MAGKLYTWGQASSGRLGNGTTTPDVTSPAQIGSATDWDRIASGPGSSHVLAIRNGQLWGWGVDVGGQIGLGGVLTSYSSPTLINSDTDWQDISTGQDFSLAIKGGKLYSTGFNGNSQLGDGTTTASYYFIQIGSDTNWSVVAAGSTHSLAIKSDGTLWSWGDNASGKTGQNTTSGNTASPTQVGSDNNWQKIAAGSSHSLAVKTTGTLWSFGSNESGRTARGTTSGSTNVPTQVGSDNDWQKIAAGLSHSFAIKTTGTLWAAGSNTNGRLGDGTTTNRSSLVQIGVSSDWQQIEASFSHSFGINNGALYTWGSATNGRLGNGTTTPDVTSPTQVGVLTDWQFVDGGLTFTIALQSANVAPANTAVPTISGEAYTGGTLTASNGTWTGTPSPTFTYQWQSSDDEGDTWTNIADETAAAYEVVEGDEGNLLRVQVTATNSEGAVTASSSATLEVVPPSAPDNTVAPALSGDARTGGTLTAFEGVWSGVPAPTIAYQWQVSDDGETGWTNVSGATGSTYRVPTSMLGKYLRAEVEATNIEGSDSAETAASDQVTAAGMLYWNKKRVFSAPEEE